MSALQEALHGPDLPGKGALSAHRPGLPCPALLCLVLPCPGQVTAGLRKAKEGRDR